MKIAEVFKLRGYDFAAPYEVEVRYNGQRYVVRAGCVVELVYGMGVSGQPERAEPTNLSAQDYDNILALAKQKWPRRFRRVTPRKGRF